MIRVNYKRQIAMTDRERAEETIEAIFKNTFRIHGKSKNLDWIKIASIKASEKLLEFRNEGLRDELIKTLNWISDKECPYAIMYGNTTHRFATIEKDYTTEQIVEKLIEYLKTK